MTDSTQAEVDSPVMQSAKKCRLLGAARQYDTRIAGVPGAKFAAAQKASHKWVGVFTDATGSPLAAPIKAKTLKQLLANAAVDPALLVKPKPAGFVFGS